MGDRFVIWQREGEPGMEAVEVELRAEHDEVQRHEEAVRDATDLRRESFRTADQRDRYGELVDAMSNLARSFDKDGVSAEHAAKVIAKAATASRPRTRYAIGRDAAILVRLARVISDRLLDRILRLGLRPHYVKTSQPSAA